MRTDLYEDEFGHTFAASGLVSLISLVQAMRHDIIPASLHCEQQNEFIDWRDSPFYVNRTNRPWPRRQAPRTGAVSAFGVSGTNAHVVVESYEPDGQEDQDDPDRAPCYLLALSARTHEALQEKTDDLIDLLQRQDAPLNLARSANPPGRPPPFRPSSRGGDPGRGGRRLCPAAGGRGRQAAEPLPGRGAA